MNFSLLERRNNGLYVINRRIFRPIAAIEKKDLKLSFEHAYDISFGNKGEHRNHRSGGSHIRKKGEIFANAFQGKLAEFAVYYQFRYKIEINPPDLSVYALGKWDDSDFCIGGKRASVKSTKSIGNLLLLEAKDWNARAEYLPNIEKGNGAYDFIFLVRLEPFCETIFKKNRLLYSDECSRKDASKLIIDKEWHFDIPGFITKEELEYVIRARHIIKKGEILNGTTKMDADNYYIQTGDMHPVNDLSKLLKHGD